MHFFSLLLTMVSEAKICNKLRFKMFTNKFTYAEKWIMIYCSYYLNKNIDYFRNVQYYWKRWSRGTSNNSWSHMWSFSSTCYFSIHWHSYIPSQKSSNQVTSVVAYHLLITSSTCYLQFTTYCLLSTAYFVLLNVYCSYCLLLTAHCLLRTAYCSLPTAYW